MKRLFKSVVPILLVISLIFTMGIESIGIDNPNIETNTENEGDLKDPPKEEPKQESKEEGKEEAGEPKQEEPTGEEPKQEEPKYEELEGEEPKQEEPKQEEPEQEEPEQEEKETEEPEEEQKPTHLKVETDDATVELYAEPGVLPEGTRLRLDSISDEDMDMYLEALEDELKDEEDIAQISLFDITILDKEGNIIQPNDDVKITINGLDYIQPSDDVFVYRIEEKTTSRPATMGNKRPIKNTNFQIDKFNPRVKSKEVNFDTDHFTIYVVGANISHTNANNRYQMYVGETVNLEERNLSRNGTWSVSSGSSVRINSSTTATNNIRAVVEATGTGNATIRYRQGYNNSYFYINVNASAIYVAGTDIKHENTNNRYQMHVGETVDLELRGGTVPNGTWSVSSGGSYVSLTGSGSLARTVEAIGAGNVTIRYGTRNNYRYFYINVNTNAIYIAGTDTKHENTSNRYQMYVGETVDLELRGGTVPNGTWSVSTGGNFVNLTGTDPLARTVEATGVGNVAIRYGTSNSNYRYFYIGVSVPSSIDTITPAPVQEVDPDQLAPGTVAAKKEAKWVDYDNRIAEINLSVQGMPVISGSDVILVLDKSGSMKDIPSNSTKTRMQLAQEASNKFITEMLGNGNPLNNRVALIPFSGSSTNGGTGEANSATVGRVNFSTNPGLLQTYVNNTVANGSTNYTAALEKAKHYADSRATDERDRPLYIVFLSDGDPGYSGGQSTNTTWNGVTQATTLKSSSYNATIYTVGMALAANSAGETALKNISSTKNGQYLYKSAFNMNDLQPILETIAGELKKAGTEAYFKDFISEYFNYYNTAPYNIGDGTYNNNPNNPAVTIDIGDILENPKNYKIYVQLKDEYWLDNDEFFTNEDIHLDYKDVNGNAAKKKKEEIGHPKLPVGHGTIEIRYVLVNENGDYISRDNPNTILQEAFRHYVPDDLYFHYFEYNGNDDLELEQEYTVNPTVPDGYQLWSGEDNSKNVEITWNDRLKKVEFKVVKPNTNIGSITITKTVTNPKATDANKEFDIFVNGPEGLYVVTLTNGESKTIENLPMGTYTISEIVPMNYKLVSISNPSIILGLDSLSGSTVVTNKPDNDSWFDDEDTRKNEFNVGIITVTEILQTVVIPDEIEEVEEDMGNDN